MASATGGAGGRAADFRRRRKTGRQRKDGKHQDNKSAYCDTSEAKPEDISTGYVKRQNLTMRMRRFTRLAITFSMKVENHRWALALYFMDYNFCRIHQTMRVTPAMEGGIAGHAWSLEEVVALLDTQISDAA